MDVPKKLRNNSLHLGNALLRLQIKGQIYRVLSVLRRTFYLGCEKQQPKRRKLQGGDPELRLRYLQQMWFKCLCFASFHSPKLAVVPLRLERHESLKQKKIGQKALKEPMIRRNGTKWSSSSNERIKRKEVSSSQQFPCCHRLSH